jgi:hypothetical protein
VTAAAKVKAGVGATTKLLTASFAFEFAPCGTLEHGLVYDYTITLLQHRAQPRPARPCAVFHEQLVVRARG